MIRTIARNFSIGSFVFVRGDLHCAREFDILKIDENSTNLQCFMSHFGGFGALFGG